MAHVLVAEYHTHPIDCIKVQPPVLEVIKCMLLVHSQMLMDRSHNKNTYEYPGLTPRIHLRDTMDFIRAGFPLQTTKMDHCLIFMETSPVIKHPCLWKYSAPSKTARDALSSIPATLPLASLPL